MTDSDGDADTTSTTTVSIEHGTRNASLGAERRQLRGVEEFDDETELSSAWYLNRENDSTPFSTLSVSATGDTIRVGGNANIDISAGPVDEVKIQDLWTDWAVINGQTDGAQFSKQITSAGNCRFVWDSSQASASPSLTVSPPGDYIGGEYQVEISAIESDSAATTTATVDIIVDCPIEISGPDAAGMESFDIQIQDLMNTWGLVGGSVAVVKDGRLVFAHGYGISDNSCESVVQPETRFRIASLTKPLTSVSILTLKEDNQISLDDRAFSILDQFKPSTGSIDSRIDDITVRHLLHHSAGWDIDELGYDPMFRSEEIATAEGKTPPASSETIIRHMLEKDLNFDPGTEYAYSNLGYAVLGHIVEEITGESYGSYVSDTVLSKMGISRMQIGNTRLENRANRESRYFDFGGTHTDSVFPDQGGVPFPYGGFYLQAMAAHGGWIASTIDLMRFVVHVDNRNSVGDVLETATIDTMTERPDIPEWQGSNYYYSKGWQVRPDSGNWWHTGSLPGTSSIVVREGQTGENLAWTAVFNSRPKDWQTFNGELNRTLWDAVGNVTEWPAHDLFTEFD